MKDRAGKEYIGVHSVEGPVVTVRSAAGVSFGEVAEVRGTDGHVRKGRVLYVDRDETHIQVFEGTRGLSLRDTRVRFLGEPLMLGVSKHMMGRVFNGVGEPLDGGPPAVSRFKRNINGLPINPVMRDYPREFIQTGLSAIDGLNTLIRGQKLPIFSGSGLPHNEIAAQIIRQATLLEEESEFAVIFGAMGLKSDDAQFFQSEFESTGSAAHVTMFLNLAGDPPEERLITPRYALTLAEYLAFDKGMHVLVILSDMTNYCEALRELSSAREEIPSRKGYPGYMYSDLASLYERTGRIKGQSGSITQIPILSMPGMDITHPIPDLTGYITEGQIVLSRELSQSGVFPPVTVLPSLSRLMKDGIGAGFTRDDHPNLASQLYAAYARAQQSRSLASIIGEEELSEIDRSYLEFSTAFEQTFINQGKDENRTIEETLDRGWDLLRGLPKGELTRVTESQIFRYL